MKKFYIQSEYQGKETSSLIIENDKKNQYSLSFSKLNSYKEDEIPVGSVEFVEDCLKKRFKPNYYPLFLEDYFKREIWDIESLSEIEDGESLFIKPADRHKRFDARIVSGYEKYEPNFYSWQTGPYWASEIRHFKNEWRYYVADGKLLAAYWYLGEDDDAPPPEINIKWPKNFCGAVDFGESRDEIVLVENNLPYACGWYGGYDDGEIYGEWLSRGFEYMRTYPFFVKI